MFGNVINNKRLTELVSSGNIKISPFDKKKVQTIHYPLNIKLIVELPEEGKKGNRIYTLAKHNSYMLKPNDYVLIEIDERIELEDGIVGEFVLSSNLIEKGLALTCGKLDPEYGKSGEAIRFGLKNLLNKEVPIEYDLKIAYVKFYDLRALDNTPYVMSKEEKRLWNSRVRKAMDDGVDYASNDE